MPFCRQFSVVLALAFCVSSIAQTKGEKPLSGTQPLISDIGDTPWDPSLLAGPKVIYGTDDRHDVYEELNPERVQWARSTCGLLASSQVMDNGNGTFTIVTSMYDVGGLPACVGEPFGMQPTAPFCTGFLVGEDLIATAGHCFDAGDVNQTRFVFGFEMLDAGTPATVVNANQVYRGVELMGWALSGGLDYAVIRVDRTVTAPGATPLLIRRSGVVPVGTSIGVIGHPSGLPLKIAFGAQTQVYANGAAGYFTANLDTYGGNSGSPVFDAATGIVEGILVRGQPDFDDDGPCFFSLELPDSAAGEDVSKTTTFMQFIPEVVTSAGYIQLDKLTYSCDDVLEVAVVDADLAGSALVSIATSNGDLEPLTLTETGSGTGRFEASIAIDDTAVVASSGTLNVVAGAAITVTYNDADAGSGPAVVEKAAEIDCAAPLISNVTVAQVFGTAAVITFSTDEAATPEVQAGPSCSASTALGTTPGFMTTHSVTLSGLTPLTTYRFEVHATDTAGNVTVDDNGGMCYTFTTTDHHDYFSELFTDGTRDLDNTTIVFTPDGSADRYSVCAQPAIVFPTDPTGGTGLLMGDDGAVEVTLGDDAEVLLYGQSYTSFFVGSNGYITFGVGDSEYVESYGNHFGLHRISGLFDDLNPGNGGLVSWRQLSDRVAVTFQNVPQYTTTDSNNFQIEMYFDGTIAVTHLQVAATDGLVGLSEGLGIPLDFIDSDLSASNPCSDADGDGLEYDDELYYGTDPNDPDTDDDGLNDYDEIFVYGTDPLIDDTDDDGFLDGTEIALGSDPLDDASVLPLGPVALATMAGLLSLAAVCAVRSCACEIAPVRQKTSR